MRLPGEFGDGDGEDGEHRAEPVGDGAGDVRDLGGRVPVQRPGELGG